MKGRLPHDSPGSVNLHGGTGDITGMCSCGDFIEVYKEGMTFRVKTPESIDPGRTNPNTPFVPAITDNVGSSSPAVARVLLQGRDILEAAGLDQKINKAAVVEDLHACKEALIVCEKAARRVASHIDGISEEIRAHGIKRQAQGTALNALPQVPDLEADATAFLIHAKRAIHSICRLPSRFLSIPAKDNNFDALAKRLAAAIGTQSPVTEFVQVHAPGVRHLIELRNLQEHPGPRRTVIENFAVLPNGSISVPMWHVSDERPLSIRDEMLVSAGFLVDMAEHVLIRLVMHVIDQRIPFVIEEIDAAQVNPKVPIKYRLSIDLSRLQPAEAPD